MKSRRSLFVIGAERCGTTLLRLCLDAHSKVTVPFEGRVSLEIAFLFRRGRRLAGTESAFVDRLFRREPKLTDWGLDRARLEESLRDARPGDARAAAHAFFDAYCEQFCPESEYWGDKNPIHVYSVPELKALHPEARFIYLARDPRAMFASVQKRLDKGNWTGMSRSVLSSGALWQMAAKHYLATRTGEYRLRYEDLVSDPRAVLSRLCAWLALPFEEAMIGRKMLDNRLRATMQAKFAGTPLQFEAIVAERRDAWRDELTLAQIEAIEYLHEPLMTRMGYEAVTHGTRWAGKALLLREALTAPHRQKLRFWLKSARFKEPVSPSERATLLR